MTFIQIQTAVQTFKNMLAEPDITAEQRAHFQECLSNAEAKLAAFSSPTVQPPTAPPSFRAEAAESRFGSRPAPSAFEAAAPAPPQAQGQGSGTPSGDQKKTAVRSKPAARIVANVSPLGSPIVHAHHVVMGTSDLLTVRFTGAIEDVRQCTELQAATLFRHNIRQAAKNKQKPLDRSRCFHRAIGYYAALCQKKGQKLTLHELGIGRKHGQSVVSVFAQIQAVQQSA